MSFCVFKMFVDDDNQKIVDLDGRGYVIIKPGITTTIETDFDINKPVTVDVDKRFNPLVFFENGKVCYTLTNTNDKEIAIGLRENGVLPLKGAKRLDEVCNRYGEVRSFKKECDDFNIRYETHLIECRGHNNYELEYPNKNDNFEEYGSNIPPEVRKKIKKKPPKKSTRKTTSRRMSL